MGAKLPKKRKRSTGARIPKTKEGKRLRSVAAKKSWKTRIANERSARARKGWETRRARMSVAEKRESELREKDRRIKELEDQLEAQKKHAEEDARRIERETPPPLSRKQEFDVFERIEKIRIAFEEDTGEKISFQEFVEVEESRALVRLKLAERDGRFDDEARRIAEEFGWQIRDVYSLWYGSPPISAA